MKPKFLAGLAFLALAPAVLGQPSGIWQNPGFTDATLGPTIDALTFWNPSGATFVFDSGVAPFQTADTLNYTNQGIINCDPGFAFETFPATFGQSAMAANFVNQASGNNGVINVTSGVFGANFVTLVGTFFFGELSGGAQCIVEATNIINSGTVNMDASSLMKFTGENVDMTRGTLAMANLSTTNFVSLNNSILSLFFGFAQGGWLDGYWGTGIAVPKFTFPFPPVSAGGGQADFLDPDNVAAGETDDYEIVDRTEQPGLDFLFLQFPQVFVQDSGVVGSNRWVEAVFLQETNPAFATSIYFPGANARQNPPELVAVQWQWTVTNLASGVIQTNYINLTDNFGEVTNIGLFQNGSVNPQAPFPEPTYKPENYNFYLGIAFTNLFGNTPAAPPSQLAGGALGLELGSLNAPYTNQYSAYEALFTTANQFPSDVAGGNVTNLAGRIEITARNVLDVTGAHISPLNYLLLSATNHFRGSDNAQIASPNSDFYLRSTNGLLLFTNLVAPFLPNAQGPCELWSTRYTNVDANSITNSFHILFVKSEFAPVTTTYVQNLDLTVTNFTGARNNLFLSDVLNVSNILLTSDAITITTNGAGAANPSGQLNMLNPNTLWPTAMPNLQYLTNYGQISNANSVFFGGSHTQPPYNPNLVNVPYQAFVNSNGLVINQGSQIWSVYFQNGSTNAGGTFQAGNGSIILQQCSDAVLMNGAFFAGGDVTIDAASLLVSNHIILSGGALTLSNSYYLDDGSYATASAFGVTNKNVWNVQNGINLPVLPAYSSLLATTITNTDLSYGAILNVWASADLGQSPAGFSDNAALGHLILDGRDPASEFDFSPPSGSTSNSIYVDLLELNNSAANLNGQGNASNVRISPGMRIYYGRALANGVELSQHLNGHYGVGQYDSPANSGQFFWVTNYSCGFFSSTNLVYPDGHTNLVNAGLAADCAGFPGDVNCDPSDGSLPVIFANACPELPPAFVQPPAPLAAPSIALASPSAGATYTAPAAVPLSATVVTNGHSISRVLFYDGANLGANLLASNSTAPYTYSWTNVSAGNYTPTAVLVYDQGSAVVATPVNVTVKDAQVAGPVGIGLVPPPADTNLPGPFKIKGVYHGLFYDTNTGVNASSAGYFTAATTTGGGVSAKIAVGGRTYSFTGVFSGAGTASGTARQGSASLNVQLQLSSDNQQIQGIISGSGWSATLQADVQAATAAGNYTLVIPPATNGPQGYGVGSVTVDGKGNLKWSGVLADGTKVTQSSAVSQQGFWPLYAPLFSGGGAVLSWMQFVSGGVDGDLIWIKPAGSGAAYPGGFTNDVPAMGSAYSKPRAGTPVLDWPGGMGSVIFDGGGLGSPITNQISLSGNNHVKDLSGTYKLTLNITMSSGLFSGSVSKFGGQSRVSFSGAIWDGTNGAGFFSNPKNGQSGSVLLQP